jgi:hypothetical protein
LDALVRAQVTERNFDVARGSRDGV